MLFEVLAFFIGFRYFLFLRKNQEDTIVDSNRIWILIGATGGAFLGSRILGGLEVPEIFFSGSRGLLYYFQAKTIVGGLLGGLIGVEWVKKMIGEKQSSGDLFTFPIMMGMMIGRVGCFSMGVYEPTYGVPSDLPWAMNLGDGILRHPTALYEILFLGSLWCFIYFLEKKVRLVSGARFKMFLASYLLYRFLVEFIRPGIVVGFGLTAIQMACLLGMIYYWKVFILPKILVERI